MEKYSFVNDENLPIIGAICGDILGSSYEFEPNKSLNLSLYTGKDEFTDDTICTIAITDALERGIPFDESLRQWCRKYPRSDYGGRFGRWIYQENGKPYNSWGNGAAMRVSAAGAYAKTVKEARQIAKATAEVTHNHPEGIKGAEATAAVIQLAKSGEMSKQELKEYVEKEFGYDLSQSYEELHKVYEYSESCQDTFPAAFISFYKGQDYEDVIRHAIALGGDADTLAAIAGSMAAAFYRSIGYETLNHCLGLLPQEMIEVLRKFRNAHSANINCDTK